jgi:hypothetical protein
MIAWYELVSFRHDSYAFYYHNNQDIRTIDHVFTIFCLNFSYVLFDG